MLVTSLQEVRLAFTPWVQPRVCAQGLVSKVSAPAAV